MSPPPSARWDETQKIDSTWRRGTQESSEALRPCLFPETLFSKRLLTRVLSCPEEKSIDALKGSEPLGLLYGAGGISLEGPWSAI